MTVLFHLLQCLFTIVYLIWFLTRTILKADVHAKVIQKEINNGEIKRVLGLIIVPGVVNLKLNMFATLE